MRIARNQSRSGLRVPSKIVSAVVAFPPIAMRANKAVRPAQKDQRGADADCAGVGFDAILEPDGKPAGLGVVSRLKASEPHATAH
jgi:hypothetical protein